MNDIQHNIVTLKQDITACEKEFHRATGEVLLLAVSKGQSLEKISLAIKAGQKAFGENYIQEALPKINALTHHNIEWHFIGPIQSNKTKKIAEHFHWVHSIDNIDIAKRLNNQRPSTLPPLNILLQVNVSHEPTKSGVDFDALLPLAEHCQALSSLKLRGLMAIPSPQNHFIDQRAEFYKLKLLYEMLIKEGFLIDNLSIGMSRDWKAAIAESSTIVRIGTTIFGSR